MTLKSWVWLGFFIGSSAGSYLPVLWHDSLFSIASIILTAVGGLLGIWAGLRLGQEYGL